MTRIRRLERGARRLGSTLRGLGHRREIRRLVIVSLGRSGTELLVDLLDAHPRIECDSEVLATGTRFPVALLEGRAAAAASRRAEVYGVKVLRHHFARYPDAGRPMLERLVRRGFTVVVLRRRNLLRQALSHHRAHGTGRFHVRAGEEATADPRFEVDPAEVVAWIGGVERDAADLDRLVDGLADVELWYEDNLATPEQQQLTVDGLCRHLGIEPAPVTASLRRGERTRLADAFVNAGQIRAHLETTPFADLWDDEAV